MINLETPLTNRILGYYFINPSKRTYSKELADILEVDTGNLTRKLHELEKEGIIESEVAGRQRYFFLNRRYPLLKEIKKIYQSKFSLTLLLKKALSSLVGLQEAYIFGSYAKNALRPESDIDLLLVGSHDVLKARQVISSLEKRLGREISIIDFSEGEYQ